MQGHQTLIVRIDVERAEPQEHTTQRVEALRNVPTTQGSPPRAGPNGCTHERGCGPWNVPSTRGRDVPVRRGGASLLLPSKGCMWARVAGARLRILCYAGICGEDYACWPEVPVGKAPSMKFPGRLRFPLCKLSGVCYSAVWSLSCNWGKWI